MAGVGPEEEEEEDEVGGGAGADEDEDELVGTYGGPSLLCAVCSAAANAMTMMVMTAMTPQRMYTRLALALLMKGDLLAGESSEETEREYESDEPLLGPSKDSLREFQLMADRRTEHARTNKQSVGLAHCPVSTSESVTRRRPAVGEERKVGQV